MSKLINIPTFTDKRGALSVIEKIKNFKINRVYYIYNFPKTSRGTHAHKKNIQLLICLRGRIKIKIRDKKDYILSNPRKGLFIYPYEYHEMISMQNNSILLVIASQFFSKSDYINE
jgi:dTDP-4-dehydrorhamnose 3,5-epimerase-like enzyme